MPECLWHKSLPKDFSSITSEERGESTMFYLKAKNTAEIYCLKLILKIVQVITDTNH